MKRKIVNINETLCDGCGLCVSACHEGAIQLVNGKAKLVSDIYCDGLGDCLGECPRGAITIEEREAAAYDDDAVKARLAAMQKAAAPAPAPSKTCAPAMHGGGGCPGMRARTIQRPAADSATAPAGKYTGASALTQWPVQLHLVPVAAPYWDGADLLVAADCVAFALGGFHDDLLKGRKLAIACPKLDDTGPYVEKLAQIIGRNNIRSVSVAHMEVPCCYGLIRIVEAALAASGKNLQLKKIEVGIDGELRG